MKTSKLIAGMLIGMMALHNVNAQDTLNIYKPVFWNADITFGIKNQGTYGGAMLRFHREDNFIAFGIRGISYVPKDLPNDYYGGLFNMFDYEGALNSNTLFLVGYGKFIPSAHKTVRVLLQADAALGKYYEAVNFKRINYNYNDLEFLVIPVTVFAGNYEYEINEGFTAGVHLLAKAELCSRFVSLGVNLETFVTTKATAFCAGVSLGFGKLRKKNN